MSKKGRKKVEVSVYLPTEWHKRLYDLATDEGITASSWARRALMNAIHAHTNGNPAPKTQLSLRLTRKVSKEKRPRKK